MEHEHDENQAKKQRLRELYAKAWGNSIFLLLEHWESLPDDELDDRQRETLRLVREARSGTSGKGGGVR